MHNPEHLLQEIIDTLESDDKLGILLTAQMGATPQEIQLLIQTADFDDESKTVHPNDTYLLRCVGVQEHRLSLGLFNRLIVVDEHPLLWNENFPYKQIYFNGTTDQVDTLMLEIHQLYGQHYGMLRSLADDINRTAPLGNILSGGYGWLGDMPVPMAEKMKTLLERYGYTVQLLDTEREQSPYPAKLMVIDDSFIIAHLFSADPLKAGSSGKVM